MPLTLTDDPHFYGLEILLSNILMIGLFRSNNRMVIFSEKKPSYYSKHVRDHTFITSTWKRDDLIGRVSKLVTCLQILFFLNKRSIAHFFAWQG